MTFSRVAWIVFQALAWWTWAAWGIALAFGELVRRGRAPWE